MSHFFEFIFTFLLFKPSILAVSEDKPEETKAFANLTEFNDLWQKVKGKKLWSSEIPYAHLKPYHDLTIPELGAMYDEGAKGFVFRYYAHERVATYKKYLFERVLDEWFLHVPCYMTRDLSEGTNMKCPPDHELSEEDRKKFYGGVCLTDTFGCNMFQFTALKLWVISIDDLRRCGPGMMHSFVAKAFGARSPIQEPDRNEHVSVNFENVEIGMHEGFFSSHQWRDQYFRLYTDLDHCRKTTEEVYHMKTSVFKKGMFEYSSVLVPETFQYSDPCDPRPVTVAKEIYEQVRMDRTKYDKDFWLKLSGNDLYRMRMFFSCGKNAKCYKKDGVCKNMGFIGSHPVQDKARHTREPVSCECFCPYSDVKGQMCDNNSFMKYRYQHTKADCFKYITEAGSVDCARLVGNLTLPARGNNVLAPKGTETFSFTRKELYSDEEAEVVTNDQETLSAEFRPSAEIIAKGGLAVAPDVWVSKQWCTFIWAPPAKKRAIITVDTRRLWESKEFTEHLPDVTRNLVEHRGDCQRALKFVHAHGPDPSKLRVKCFSMIYFNPEQHYTIYSNTTRMTAYIYWDWYLTQNIPRILGHALKLKMVTKFDDMPSHTLGERLMPVLKAIPERPLAPRTPATTEYWQNPEYPMDDFFASISNNTAAKVTLIIFAILIVLALLGGAGYVLYYYIKIKPKKDAERSHSKHGSAFTTPAEHGSRASSRASSRGSSRPSSRTSSRAASRASSHEKHR